MQVTPLRVLVGPGQLAEQRDDADHDEEDDDLNQLVHYSGVSGPVMLVRMSVSALMFSMR